jgi:AcrR family transcriptional regulator
VGESVNPSRRTYRAPQRDAAAARTREAIVAAGADAFVRLGWSGATMRGIADQASVSIKTVEARYGKKAALLKDVVYYAIAGQVVDVPTPPRESITAMKSAGTAAEMLKLHARHVRTISVRAAGIFWVVEHAAQADEDAAVLWSQLLDDRRFGARWAAKTLLTKPDLPRGIRQSYAEEVFWMGIEPASFRSLTLGRGFTPDQFESWIEDFYVRMLMR